MTLGPVPRGVFVVVVAAAVVVLHQCMLRVSFVYSMLLMMLLHVGLVMEN